MMPMARKTSRLHRLIALLGAAALGLVALPVHAQAQGRPTILRDRLTIVAATNAERVAALVTQGFLERYPDATVPEIQGLPTSRAGALFCAGVGVAMADLLVTTRRMSSSAREHCSANGVEEAIELRLGLGAVVLAVRRGDPQPTLSTRHVYEALAAETAGERGFDVNRAIVWSQLTGALPNEQIRFILPANGSGLRELFEDTVLESGCRPVRQIRMIFEAGFRRDKCITLRIDGRVTELPASEITARLVASPRGTIAVTTFDDVTRSGGNLIALPLDGVVPTRNSIASGEYEPTLSLIHI